MASVNTNQPMYPTQSYIDYLGRTVTETPYDDDYVLEKVQTGEFLEDPEEFISKVSDLSLLRFPKIKDLQHRITCQEGNSQLLMAQIYCLQEATHQRVRQGIGVPADVPLEVDPEGRLFTRLRPKTIPFQVDWQKERDTTILAKFPFKKDETNETNDQFYEERYNQLLEIAFRCEKFPECTPGSSGGESLYRFSAIRLRDGDITETHIQDVARLFYMQVLYNIDLLGPAVEGYEDHRFHVCGKNIIVGLPFGEMRYGYSPTTLLRMFQNKYPLKLFRDAEKSITDALEVKVYFNRIKKHPGFGGKEVKLRAAQMPDYPESMKFTEKCIELFECVFSETSADQGKVELLIEQVRNLYFIEKRKRWRESDFLGGLKKAFNLKLGKSFQFQWMDSPFELFKEMFLKDVLADTFLLERIYLASAKIEGADQRYSTILLEAISSGAI